MLFNPSDFDLLTVKNIIQETSRAKTIVLQKADDTVYNILPGQFITLVFEDKNAPLGFITRSYSISKVAGKEFSITVKELENGWVSRRLNTALEVDHILYSSGVGGVFTLPTDYNNYPQIAFFAAGSGITPIFNIITHLLNSEFNGKIWLVYSNSTPSQAIFKNELELLVQSYPDNFKIEWLFSDSGTILKARLSNFLLWDFMKDYVIVPHHELLAYICGPIEYMDMVRITLLGEGVKKENIKQEIFDTYIEEELLSEPDDKGTHKVKILNNTAPPIEFEVTYPDSILDAALKNEIKLPFSCRSGQCGTCVTKCISGEVFISYNEVLTPLDIKNGFVLTCQGHPINGDVVIKYN